MSAASRRRGGARAVLAAGALSLASLAGCTLLVSFDDVARDGGDLAPLPPHEDGQVAESGADGKAPPPPPPKDAGARDVDLDALRSCADAQNGLYCGDNQIVAYPYADDLVACDGGKVVAAKPCLYGAHCIHMRDPHPDQCDECHTKTKDGYYCGKDMPGWVTSGSAASTNANARVHCMSGGEDEIFFCPNVCNGGVCQ